MAKRGIYNEQPFRGRFKGNTDGRVTNPTWRENAERCKLGGHSFFCTICEKEVFGTKIECEIHKETCTNE